MNILFPKIENYLSKLMVSDDAVLRDMEKHAAKSDFPIIGPAVGRLLFQYARALQAQRIFELGSGFGYSALWFACAMPDEGQIYCTDFLPENLHLAERYFDRAGLRKKLSTLAGSALESLAKTDGEFDIILMDIDKEIYPQGFRQAWPRLRQGGMFIVDNTLWKGKVAEENPDETTRNILELTRLVFAQKDALATLLPLRDGVIVAMKI